MSNEEIVKQKYPKATYCKVLHSPDPNRIGMIVIESTWKSGDELGIGMTPDEAWSVAASNMRKETPCK